MENFDQLIWPVILILGIVQGVLLSGILFLNKNGNRSANSFLGATILILVWHHLQAFTIFTQTYKSFPHFYGADYGSIFLFGPLLFLYSKSLTDKHFQFKKSYLLHFVPFLIMMTINPVVFQGTEQKVETIISWLTAVRYDNEYLRVDYFNYYIMIFSELSHLVIYLIITYVTINKYSKSIKNTMSNIDKINLNWLKKLTLSFGAAILVGFVSQKIYFATVHYYYPSMDYMYILPVTIFIYVIGFNAMKQPTIYTETISRSIVKPKYETSSLKPELSKQYRDELEEIMVKEKPYLDPDLKLLALAKILKISPNHLSQVINEKFNLSFFDFINKYRVEEAKSVITENANNDTLLQIAFQVGFNNKVSFNKYFSKLTGKTPSEYKKSPQK